MKLILDVSEYSIFKLHNIKSNILAGKHLSTTTGVIYILQDQVWKIHNASVDGAGIIPDSKDIELEIITMKSIISHVLIEPCIGFHNSRFCTRSF